MLVSVPSAIILVMKNFRVFQTVLEISRFKTSIMRYKLVNILDDSRICFLFASGL